MADYCMAKLETDDEIAIADCLEEERAVIFGGDCAAKRHYKTRLCQAAVARGEYKDRGQCIADRKFRGTTVRKGGVGGGK